MKFLQLILASLVASSLLFTSFDQLSAQTDPPVVGGPDVVEAADNFHREVIKAVVKARKEGKITRTEAVRIRVAMISPAFRKRVEDVAVMQLAASGQDTGLPIGEDGKINRAQIDWEALADFLERIIPLIMQLIQAFIDAETVEEAQYIAAVLQASLNHIDTVISSYGVPA